MYQVLSNEQVAETLGPDLYRVLMRTSPDFSTLVCLKLEWGDPVTTRDISLALYNMQRHWLAELNIAEAGMNPCLRTPGAVAEFTAAMRQWLERAKTGQECLADLEKANEGER